MYLKLIVFHCAFLMVLTFSSSLITDVKAQNQLQSSIITFSAREQKQLEKAEALIMRGENIYSSVANRESDSENEKAGSLITKYGQKERNKDLLESHLNAISLYFAGYSKKSKVLKERVERYLNENQSEAASLNDVLTNYQSKKSEAAEAYRKSRSIKSLDEAVKLGEKAVEIHKSLQIEMIDNLSAALNMERVTAETVQVEEEPEVKNEPVVLDEDSVVTVEQEDKKTKEEVIEQSNNEVVAPPVVTEIAEKETPEEGAQIIEEKVKEEINGVYFAIQILALRTQATPVQIKQVYAGNREVVEMYGDTWYRYSIGRFLSYKAAKLAMKRERVQGFIVAYHQSERISIGEAQKLLSE